MTTSGNTLWGLTRNQIINGALRKCQVLSEGMTATSSQIADASEALNNLVAEYRALGMMLWKRVEIEIPTVVDQKDYSIGIAKEIDVPYPLHVLQARLQTSPTSTYINLNILPSYRFNLLPPTSTGVPVSVVYQPKIDYGVLSVWPTPNAAVPSGTKIILTAIAPTEVFDVAGDYADFPGEWYNALVYGLALLLADEFALPLQDKQWIEKQSERHLATALSNGTEDGSFFISPDSRRQ